MTLPTDQLDRLAVDTIRTLSIDGVQQANSGHPGAPMGMAPMAYALWTRHLRHAPTHPAWPNRDRFVLSAGHASMLLYSLLHLTGYDVSLDDLKRFRQWGSITPGHPEYGLTPGVEATTGPLGQGFANAVGMAIAERRLAAEFNRPGHDDHRPPDLRHLLGRRPPGGHRLRGRLAGRPPAARQAHRPLRRQPDPARRADRLAFTEDVLARFDAYGWHTQRVDDGNDVEAIDAAIEAAKADDRPVADRRPDAHRLRQPEQAGLAEGHGAPLGPDEVRLTKEAYGWDPDRTFFVPDEAGALFLRAVAAGEAAVAAWDAALDAYAAAYPAEAAELRRRVAGRLADGWDAGLNVYETGSEVATRNASQDPIQALAGAACRSCSAARRTCPSPT